MKTTFIIVLCLVQQLLFGQNNWIIIENNECGISFSMPQQPDIFDTLNVKYYNTSLDTNVVLQTHIIHNQVLKETDSLIWNSFIQQLLIVTNSELVQNNSVIFCENEKNTGRLLGVSYMQEEIIFFMFIHAIIYNENLIVQSIIIPQQKLINTISIKNYFFNSLKCN